MNIKFFVAPKVYTCYKKMQEKVNKVKKQNDYLCFLISSILFLIIIYVASIINAYQNIMNDVWIPIVVINTQNHNEPNISQLVQINSFTHAIVHSSLLFTQSDISADTKGNTNAMTKKIQKVAPIIP